MTKKTQTVCMADVIAHVRVNYTDLHNSIGENAEFMVWRKGYIAILADMLGYKENPHLTVRRFHEFYFSLNTQELLKVYTI